MKYNVSLRLYAYHISKTMLIRRKRRLHNVMLYDRQKICVLYNLLWTKTFYLTYKVWSCFIFY